MGHRTFDYRGHLIQLEEVDSPVGKVWHVYVDRRIAGSKGSERLASDLGYATVDRMIEDAAIRERLVELAAARVEVRGFPFDRKVHEVGQPVWVQWRGMWRRGLVDEVRGGKVRVALLVQPDAPKIKRSWAAMLDVVLAPI